MCRSNHLGHVNRLPYPPNKAQSHGHVTRGLLHLCVELRGVEPRTSCVQSRRDTIMEGVGAMTQK
jgi:hypothetical protein